MPLATHASLVLARFDDLRDLGPVQATSGEGTFFLQAGADSRAAGTTAKAQRAYKFVVYGLHASEGSARRAVADRQAVAPWIEGASEVWSAVLRPFRHFGEANFLDASAPGPVFEVAAAPPAEGTPIVITTTVGWDSMEGEAMERIMRFSDGVTAVRIGMTGLRGLHSQQTFVFAGGLTFDGLTVTLWRDLASAMAFAYSPGKHRAEVKTQRETLYGDRTSFTRFEVVSSEGSWHGTDPLAW